MGLDDPLAGSPPGSHNQVTGDFGYPSQRIRVLIVCMVLCPAAFIATVNLGWANTAVHIIAATLAVTAVLYLLIVRVKPDMRGVALGKPRAITPTEEEINRAVRYVAENYAPDAIDYFVNSLLALPTFLSRVDERAEIVGRKLAVHTSLQYRTTLRSYRNNISSKAGPEHDATGHEAEIAQAAVSDEPPVSPTLLVPLVTARKGLLFDQFLASTSSDDALAVLPQWEARGLVAIAVRALFYYAAAESLQSETRMDVPQVRMRDDNFRIMTDVIVNAVCQVGGKMKNSPQQQTRIWRRSGSSVKGSSDQTAAQYLSSAQRALRDRYSSLARLDKLGDEFNVYWKEKIRAICSVLAESYLIVAEVPSPKGGNLVVRYSSQYSPERRNTIAYERLRVRCGLDPYMIDVPMTRAFQADSYHFELLGPPDQYVFSHHVEGLRGREPLGQDVMVLGQVQQYVRVHHEGGRSTAHLYVRKQGSPFDIDGNNIDALIPPDFKSVICLREIPPGTLRSAATLASLSALVILFFTITRVGMDSAGTSAEIPALILALPAFVSSAVGQNMDGDKIGRASLITYFGLLIVAYLSVFSTLLYLYDATHHVPTEIHLSLIGHRHLHTDAVWLALSFIAVTMSIFLIHERHWQLKYYLGMLKRSAVDIEERNAHNGGV